MNFTEKRALRTEFLALEKQKSGGEKLSFKEKRSIRERQIEIRKALGLNLSVAADTAPAETESQLDKLKGGEFNNLKPIPFIELVESLVASNEASVDDVKQPIIDYYEKVIAA